MLQNLQANEMIDKWNETQPDKVYLYFKDQEITYRELAAKANSVANKLLELGVQKGDRLALSLKNCPEFLYAWLAVNKIGAIAVPFNSMLKADETAFILNNSGCIALIAENEFLAPVILPALQKCPSVKWVAARGNPDSPGVLNFSDFLNNPSPVKTIHWDDEELAAIIYTSGTTGNPKGVMCPHRLFSLNGEAFAQWFKLTPEDRLFTLLPLYHVNALNTSTMGSLARGASLILLDGFNPETFWLDIARYKATIFNYLGSMLPVLMKRPITPEERNHHLRLAIGAQADPDLIETYEKRWGVVLIELYGMTEIGGTVNPLDRRKKGSCGVPFYEKTVKIVDDKGEELPPYQVGEIIMTSQGSSTGYWQNPEETAKTYRDGWVYSGDLGYMDEEGYLFFAGRKKDIVRRSGENISAMEVENAVMSHPGVMIAAVLPVPDPIRDEEVKVYVVLKQGETPESVPPEDIIRWCEEKLAKFKVPRYIEYRDSLPRTETQKIAKAVLKSEKTDLTAGTWDRFAEKNRKKGR